MLSTQKSPEPKKPPATEPAVAEPTPTTVHETILSMDLTEWDTEGPTVHEKVPDPPKCIKRRLEANECVWRWLSKPHVDKKGKRMYSVYSPTDDERRAIEKGDCPPGVSVSVDNRVCWGEDAFLGYLPRRFFDERQKELDKLNTRLRKQSQAGTEFTEFAKRSGFKSPSVTAGPDDRPTFGMRG